MNGAAAVGLLASVTIVIGAQAAACIPPEPPFVPSDAALAESYRDLIRADFEAYFSDVTRYIACLDGERARALREAGEVAQRYEVFLDQRDPSSR